MSDAIAPSPPPPDDAARRRILEDLDTNLFVEAGAGSGKTTALIGRMVALIETDTARIDEIAAVTFTRKAAAELRERFQEGLERRLRELDSAEGADSHAADVRGRIDEALREIDRAFIGTIHAFCARLLRERPLEVGIDPGFEEVPVEERARESRRFWNAFVERMVRDSDPAFEALAAVGVSAAQLRDAFETMLANPDVTYPVEEMAPPSDAEVAKVRRTLEEMLEEAFALIPDPPDGEWDSLQKKLHTLRFLREVTDWKERGPFFDALQVVVKDNPHTITQKRWRAKEPAKDFAAHFNAFVTGDGPAARLMRRWYAHRYSVVVQFLRRAVDACIEDRRRRGRLDFHDLLALAASLLRDNPGVRRDLGRRYRRLLVDEFQDTDPLQAEIMLLLASEPDADWREAVPRPGALFVVGDPKQSIYRFRRADIQLYQFVRERFRAFGDVLHLTANFRSVPAIGALVNDVFDSEEFFPREATHAQAAFEPLHTQPSGTHGGAGAEGVFWYRVEEHARRRGETARDDAARLAPWIAERIRRGERQPGDFLILTRWRDGLDVMAAALEEHGVPVQVTGAGVGVEEELRELQTLLACMADPTDETRVVAALVGLFFGLDYEDLVEHRLQGGTFSLTEPSPEGTEEVRRALRRLRRWWREAKRAPADVFISSLARRLGLLPLAGARELGSVRAGALVFALEAVRAAALRGEASLPGAMEALDEALALKEAEAPLEPERADVVRIMNLHQAKGLEAEVVVLAYPEVKRQGRGPELHVARDPRGEAFGYLAVSQRRGNSSRRVAEPVGWAEHETAETGFQAAEEVRLLYVAVTRARRELVVARRQAKPEKSPWGPLDEWLERHGTELDLHPRPAGAREAAPLTAEDARILAEEAGARLRAAGAPSYRVHTVTELAKATEGEGEEAAEGPRVVPAGTEEFRGFSWGSAVHAALAAAAGGEDEETLRARCRDVLVEQGRPVDDHGDPLELEELVALVRRVLASDLWRRAQAADRVLAEVPFAVRFDDARAMLARRDEGGGAGDGAGDPGTSRRQLELFGGAGAVEGDGEPAGDDTGGVPEVLEGVIDLAFREEDGWVVADYKTDVGTDPEFPVRAEAYRRQVTLYAEAWARLTQEPVKERVLFFTAQDRTESW